MGFNCCWETSVGSLAKLLQDAGFIVERISRCPYIDQCPECGIFELDDCVMLLRRDDAPPTSHWKSL